MNQQSGTINAKTRRKSSIGGSLAVVVAAVALAFGASGAAQAADVHGNIVAAERYRAPQPSTQDVELGDDSAQIRAAADRRAVTDRQADDVTADRFKANPRKNSQADDLSADRFKANPRNNSQADDMTADRFKANPRKLSQADDLSADRFKANPRKFSQADDRTAERHSNVDGESTDDKHKGG